MATVCHTCGDVGFSRSFIYCDKCQDYAVHGYCLDEFPTTFGESVTWFCEDCKPNAAKGVSGCITLDDEEMQISGSSSLHPDQSPCSDYSDKDCELDGQQDMVLDDEQLNESTETCLDPQSMIDPICSNNYLHTLQSNGGEIAAGQLLTNATTKKNKGRGPVKLLNLMKAYGVKREVVEYNSKGQAIGEASVKLGTFLGALGRTLVPVIYKSWSKVPRELKDKIWSYVEATFIVDSERRSSVLSSTSITWRNFKTKLTSKYILPFKNQPELLKHPPEGYDFIKQEHWDTFVRSRLSEEFLKFRQLQQERQAKNVFKHRLGQKGYARLREELKRSFGVTKEIDRSILWKEGHKNKMGEYVEKEVKECATKIDELTKLVEEGSLAIAGSHDILTMALGTAEHTGQVRGAGHSVTPKSYFNTSNCRLSRMEEQQKLMALQIEKLQEEVRTLKELLLKTATPQSDSFSCNTSVVDISPTSVEERF